MSEAKQMLAEATAVKEVKEAATDSLAEEV